MTRDAIEAYLDDPEQRPDGGEAAQLADILDTLEKAPVADPGETYFRGFEARVRHRIAERRRPKRFRLLAWSSLPVAAALSIAFLITENPVAASRGLEGLSDDQLALISEALPPLEEETTADLVETDWRLLLGEPDEEDLEFDALLDLDPDTLKSMLSEDG